MTLDHDLLRSRTIWLGVLAIAWLLLVGLPSAHGAEPELEETTSFFDLEARRLGGEVEPLDRYRGQVLLVVNTASRCGNTPQYEGLQQLYTEERGRGFTILGFPSNDFGQQEPGSDAEIGAFCKKSYGVEFPMFSKVEVKGDGVHPVYAFLTSQPAPVGGPVRWNFQKYLVDRSGRVVARFDPKVKPDDSALLAEIERLLAETPPG